MAERKPDYSTENKMVVRNDYIYAKHPDKLSIYGMRLMRIAITQCKKNDKEFYEYAFNVQDLAEMIGCENSNLYRVADDITTKLLQVVLITGSIIAPNSKGKKYQLFHKCEYDKGHVRMQIHPDAADLFLNLNKNNPFTRIPVAPLLLMQSKYGIRIFELICQKMMSCYPYADKSTEIIISIDEIRSVTNTEKKKTYEQVGHLKDKILFPAITDIEQAAEWRIICKNLKEGRKVTGFILQIWSAAGYAMMERMKAKGELPVNVWGD